MDKMSQTDTHGSFKAGKKIIIASVSVLRGLFHLTQPSGMRWPFSWWLHHLQYCFLVFLIGNSWRKASF